MEDKFNKKGVLFRFLFILFSSIVLSACASSSVTRSVETHVDNTYDSTDPSGLMNTEAGLTYENYSQTSKGVIVGAGVGAATGAMMSGTVGILPGAAGGAVLGGVFGAYIDRHTTLRDQLENRGAKVLVLGDQILIVLPSGQIFSGMTAQIYPQARSTLDLVGQLIRGLTTISVRVAAYTNATGSDKVNCVVSQQQADAVVKYLFPITNTRVITGTGYGGTHLIARNSPVWDDGANYRVEISLEKLPT
jgi:outer membrane protein OmpA-like peptidoglycan-associated protein